MWHQEHEGTAFQGAHCGKFFEKSKMSITRILGDSLGGGCFSEKKEMSTVFEQRIWMKSFDLDVRMCDLSSNFENAHGSNADRSSGSKFCCCIHAGTPRGAPTRYSKSIILTQSLSSL